MPASTLKRTLAALAVLATVSPLAACGEEEPETGSDSAATSSPESPDSTDSSGEAAGSCEYVEEGGAAKDAELPPAEPTVSGEVAVTIETGAGAIPATLDAAAAPCTVGSFVSLAEQGYFDDTSCHRLTTQGIYVLQCGDPSGSGAGGPGYSFADELTGQETYGPGTLAMANAGPDTNGSQFFIVYGESPLDPDYTVFGQVQPAGLKVVEAIAARGAQGGAPDGPPAEPVEISGVTLG